MINLSGYMLVACNGGNQIRLWKTDGTTHTNTGKSISINGPYGLDMDSFGRIYAVSSTDNKVYAYNPPNCD